MYVTLNLFVVVDVSSFKFSSTFSSASQSTSLVDYSSTGITFSTHDLLEYNTAELLVLKK